MPIPSKSRWKLPFTRRASSPPPQPPSPPSPPMSFICPISSSLMFDPVILPSGHTFERACIQACLDLNITPPSLPPSPSPSPSAPFVLIPNSNLKAAILDWCDRFALPPPSPLSQESARSLVQLLIATDSSILKSAKKPSTSTSSSSSSYPSSYSSSFSSSEINVTAATTTTSTATTAASLEEGSSNNKNPVEDSLLTKLKSPQLAAKEEGLIALRQLARESSEQRVALCTARILSALVPLILSKNASIQNNSTAALVNLSIEAGNKVKVVRSGALPHLVELVRSGSGEARDNAAGAVFSLALGDENKLAIGVLGAIPPLVGLFCGAEPGRHLARVEAGMALYHLSLAPNNLSKIAKTAGAVKAILNVATMNGGATLEEERAMKLQLRKVALMVLASLARKNDGRVALMDAGAVRAMVGLVIGLQEEGKCIGKEEAEDYNYCLAVIYEMSRGSLRFRGLARAAGAERVLLALDSKGEGGDIGKEMVRRTLKVIRGGDDRKGMMVMSGDEGEEEDEEVASVVSDGLLSFRRRCRDDFGGGSESNSANF